jgi:glucose-6-phosphate isomerase
VRAGHPCYSIALRDVSPAALGCLFYFWELVVIFYAALENINPFDQPGVEEGKKMTYTLMGRREYAAHQETERAALAEYARSSKATTLG